MAELAKWVWIIILAFLFGSGMWQLAIYAAFFILMMLVCMNKKY